MVKTLNGGNRLIEPPLHLAALAISAITSTAAERHDAHETTRTVPGIMSLHGVMITKIEETVQTKTETVITATTATITTIANGGCQAILVEDVAIMTTMMETDAETTARDDDRILESQADILVIVRRNQATHRHSHHPRLPHHQTDIHEGHTIADNPPPPALGVELSVVPCVMSDGLRDSDPEQ
jgi:hypothetical protein